MNPYPELFKALAEDFYGPYADRNNSLAEFADDVRSLGGKFLGGYVETTRTHAIVSDENSVEIARYPLTQVYKFIAGRRRGALPRRIVIHLRPFVD
jgi:hypothetical protein